MTRFIMPFREPRERCYCGAMDCLRCRPGCNVRNEEDPDDARDRDRERDYDARDDVREED